MRGDVELKPGIRDLAWMTVGGAALLVLVALAVHFNPAPGELLAQRARKLEIVDGMAAALASAAEAEKSAVLAVTDEDSRTFADQARRATADVERRRKELEPLLGDAGDTDERDLLAKFAAEFAEFERVDEQILALAVRNTNLKAYALAYGPGAAALGDMDAALSRVVSRGSASSDGSRVTSLALGAEAAAWHVQALLPPHIAEESDEKMAALESLMAEHERRVKNDLDGLAALPALANDADVAAAAASWQRYRNLKVQILALSHENTNVLSTALSLSRKRQVTIASQDALAALRDAIAAEPVAGTRFGRPLQRPR